MAVTAALDASAPRGSYPILRFRWVDDLAERNAAAGDIAVYLGLDTDLPMGPRDDDSGSELFYVDWSGVDRSGEPRFVSRGVSLVGGDIEGA